MSMSGHTHQTGRFQPPKPGCPGCEPKPMSAVEALGRVLGRVLGESIHRLLHNGPCQLPEGRWSECRYWDRARIQGKAAARDAAPVVAERVADERERIAQVMLNTVDPLLPGHEARMACVRIVRADREASGGGDS